MNPPPTPSALLDGGELLFQFVAGLVKPLQRLRLSLLSADLRHRPAQMDEGLDGAAPGGAV